MTRRARHWSIAVLAMLAMLAMLMAGIALFDWNLLKGTVEVRVQQATGRRLDIGASVATLAAPEQGTRLATTTVGEGQFYRTPLRFPGRGGSLVEQRSGTISGASKRP